MKWNWKAAIHYIISSSKSWESNSRESRYPAATKKSIIYCVCYAGQQPAVAVAAARSLAAPCLWSEQTRTQRDCDFPLLLLDTSSSSNCAAKAEAAGTAAVSLHQTLIHTIWITYKYKCMKCCRIHITAIIIKILQSFEVGGKINKTVWK